MVAVQEVAAVENVASEQGVVVGGELEPVLDNEQLEQDGSIHE